MSVQIALEVGGCELAPNNGLHFGCPQSANQQFAMLVGVQSWRRFTTQATSSCRDQTLGHSLVTPAESVGGRDEQLIDLIGGPCRDRTYDQLIKSQLLYQLS